MNDLTSGRQAFYHRIEPHHLAPLWTRLKGLVPDEPTPIGAVHHWKYDEVRPFVLEAAQHITAQEAERRVLILENPGLAGTSRVTNVLFAGIQLIMPGEVAPAHRHTQSALRFILEGHGAYTAVEGEKTTMRPGDFVITPAWTWHHHGNESDEPMMWLDGLDIPLALQLGATFREEHAASRAPVTRPEGDALARYGSGLVPVGYRPGTLNSPVFNYPWERTREALHAISRGGEPHAQLGHLMRFVNPNDGGWAMPTMATTIRLLPAGFATKSYRATDSAVFVAVEGRGTVRAGDRTFDVSPRDVFVIPGWIAYAFEAAEDLVLFSFSDRVIQEKLGFFREARV